MSNQRNRNVKSSEQENEKIINVENEFARELKHKLKKFDIKLK